MAVRHVANFYIRLLYLTTTLLYDAVPSTKWPKRWDEESYQGVVDSGRWLDLSGVSSSWRSPGVLCCRTDALEREFYGYCSRPSVGPGLPFLYYYLEVKVKLDAYGSYATSLAATETRVPYWITECYQPPSTGPVEVTSPASRCWSFSQVSPSVGRSGGQQGR